MGKKGGGHRQCTKNAQTPTNIIPDLHEQLLRLTLVPFTVQGRPGSKRCAILQRYLIPWFYAFGSCSALKTRGELYRRLWEQAIFVGGGGGRGWVGGFFFFFLGGEHGERGVGLLHYRLSRPGCVFGNIYPPCV